jgi:hypothetical protein
LKSKFIGTFALKKLEDFFCLELDYQMYMEDAIIYLTDIILENKKEQTEEFAQNLARRCAHNEPDAVDKVNAILRVAHKEMDDIMDDAKASRAKELAQGYARRELRAVKQVDELLEAAGRTFDSFIAEALAQGLDAIERIDRITALAETRRNATLHEIERYRAVLSGALRRGAQEVEDAEFEEIETSSAKGKSAA